MSDQLRSPTVSIGIHLEFSNIEYGWSDLDLRIGDERLRIESFSYIKNSFHDIALAGVSAACGGGQALCQFSLNGEPTEWRWTINNLFRKGLGYYSHVVVEEFPSDSFFSIDGEGRYQTTRSAESEVIFNAFCSSEELALAIRRAFLPLEKDGILEFEKKWGLNPFPTRTLAALDAALDTPRRWFKPELHSGPYDVISEKREQ